MFTRMFFLERSKEKERQTLPDTAESLWDGSNRRRETGFFYDLLQWSDDMFWLVPFLFCFGRSDGLAALQEENERLEVAAATTTTQTSSVEW